MLAQDTNLETLTSLLDEAGIEDLWRLMKQPHSDADARRWRELRATLLSDPEKAAQHQADIAALRMPTDGAVARHRNERRWPGWVAVDRIAEGGADLILAGRSGAVASAVRAQLIAPWEAINDVGGHRPGLADDTSEALE